MRLTLAVVCISGAAFAEPPPGTGGDALRETIAVSPAIVDHELLTGLAMRGAGPENTVLLFEGFEVPFAFHDGGVRSIVPAGSLDAIDVMPSVAGVEYGRASSFVALTPRKAARSRFLELTTVDTTVHGAGHGLMASARLGTHALAREWRATDTSSFADAIARYEHAVTKRWQVYASGLYTDDNITDDVRFVRGVVGSHYKNENGVGAIALSPYRRAELDAEVTGIDTRLDATFGKSELAGLRAVQLRYGMQSHSANYAIGDVKLARHDFALWSFVAANLAANIRATTGLRLDYFHGADLATQPRAQISAQPERALRLAIAAGAYRRPPNQLHEVTTTTLNPERATHIAAGGAYDVWRGFNVKAIAYYVDRSRLVIRDANGVLSNSGTGTSLGVELHATLRDGPWLAMVTASVSSSTRQDFLRARERPAEYDQPFRANLVGGYTRGRWTFGARLRLASGLPYTPINGSIYDSDTDTFEPLLDRDLFSARTPFHHQIDLRVDYHVNVSRHFVLEAFLDLHNAYANESAIAYRYSYDYQQRSAVSALPLFPLAGLRANL